MGRRREKDLDLPPRVRRKGNSYYYDTGGKPRRWIPLGSDKAEMRRKWAEIEGSEPDPTDKTFSIVATRYEREIMPRKAYRTQKGNAAELGRLLAAFGRMPIDEIRPSDVRRYLDLRGEKAKTRANREKALLSHIFNMARSWGYTDAPNPCAGVKGHKEAGRDRYVTDDEFEAVYRAAHYTVQDAMDVALLTGQRPADILKITRADIEGGALHFRQNKTGHRLAVEIAGELAEVLARIANRPAKVKGRYLIQDEDGQPLTYWMLRGRFDAAREAAGVNFQFRDIRAKTATEASAAGGMDRAQRLLGHKNVTMTHAYVRARKGERVKPLR